MPKYLSPKAKKKKMALKMDSYSRRILRERMIKA